MISPAPSASRGLGRVTLDVRQDLSPWKQAAFVGASLIFGLAISIVILAVAGIPPLTLASELAGVLTAENLSGVLVQAAPLILVGLGASLAFRIGFWNLGIEGQMIFGGIFAAAISIYDIGPQATRLVLMGSAAALGGALWVLLVAFLKTRFRVNEIIATLLLNYVAMYFLFHLLYGAWQDAKTAFPQSTPFRPFERLGDIGYGVNSGLLIAIAGVLAAGWLIHLSRIGFYTRFISANPRMAKIVGVPVQTATIWIIAASGACSGLAGFVNVASQEGRLTQSYANGYVFSGVLIAFLSRNDPIVIAIVGFLIAVLFITGQTLQVFYQIPFTMVQMIEAIIVMAVASSEFLIRHRIRWLR
ncbi:ABC transporter permease [Bradyrhizobium jicamae]|uniref:ABC transporter permease n=1 Tax=Bradyrhizobium jicamae TaxID=280332 RepID=UPI001BAA22D9|nr:ABC transporter permease [Bradyrhizobium jicamae]MBR0752000.1 ABC transporter permease [Bradyrhizobium jicamae]